MKNLSKYHVSIDEAREQIKRNSPPFDYNVHYEVITMEDGTKALKRVLIQKEKNMTNWIQEFCELHSYGSQKLQKKI